MARVGFKKTFLAGTFDKAAVQALFVHLKTFVTNAGFNVLLDTIDGIDFIRMGSPAGTADDDIPHWAFSFQDQDPYGAIFAYPVYGNDYLDANAYAHSYLPNLQSVLMDEDTLLRHKALWVDEKEQHPAAELTLLTEAEQALYQGLKQQLWGQNVRLEQERIRWDAAWRTLQSVVKNQP